jgi:hypothetical protein
MFSKSAAAIAQSSGEVGKLSGIARLMARMVRHKMQQKNQMLVCDAPAKNQIAA